MKKYNQQEALNSVVSNIIRVKTTPEDHGKHVAQKPLELMELLIELVTAKEQIVLDPFMGSGTTCVAAKRLNRHYIGIDIDEKNVEIAKERINEPFQTEL